jgi:hypothetical protein
MNRDHVEFNYEKLLRQRIIPDLIRLSDLSKRNNDKLINTKEEERDLWQSH